MAKIVLVDNITPYIFENKYTHSKNQNRSLGLYSLYSYLKEEPNIKVELLDGENISGKVRYGSFYKDITGLILSQLPDIVGFTSRCDSLPFQLRIANMIKSQNHKIIILFGGPKASQCGEKILKRFSFVDYVFQGEAEHVICQLFNCLFENKKISHIPNLIYRDENQVISNQANSYVENLDDLKPLHPDYFRGSNQIAIESARGCPFGCTFCSTSKFFQRIYRKKTMKILFDQIQRYFRALSLDQKDREVVFIDDSMFISREDILRFLQEYHKTHSEFQWKCCMRYDLLDKEIIEQLREANLTGIFFGIESGSERIQKIIKKNLNLSHLLSIIELCEESGIATTTSFIFGFPQECEEDIRKSLDLIFHLLAFGNNDVQVYMLLPHANSDLFLDYGKELKYDGNFGAGVFSYTYEKSDIYFIENNLDIFTEYMYYDNKGFKRENIIFIDSFLYAFFNYRLLLFLYRIYLNKSLFDLWREFNKYFAIKHQKRRSLDNAELSEQINRQLLKFFKRVNRSVHKKEIKLFFNHVLNYCSNNYLLSLRAVTLNGNYRIKNSFGLSFDVQGLTEAFKRFALNKKFEINQESIDSVLYTVINKYQNKLNERRYIITAPYYRLLSVHNNASRNRIIRRYKMDKEKAESIMSTVGISQVFRGKYH